MRFGIRFINLMAVFALLVSTSAMAQDEGGLYKISMNSGADGFAVYDIATDSWTDLAPFPSRTQMATSADGRLFGFNSTADEIQEYNPVADTWSFIQAAPPVAENYGNLEFRSNGEWVYNQHTSSTLYYTVAGAWQTLALPFTANAIGDYDPVSDTLVVGEVRTNYFHAIDMGTLTITPFTTDTNGQGELARCGQIRNGRFYYQTDNEPLRFLNLADNTAAPTDVAPLYGFYESCAVSETEELIFGANLAGSLLSSVSLLDSTVINLAGTTSPGNHSSITWVGLQDVEISDTARFHVTKTFEDGFAGSVDVNLTCNGGLPLQQDFTIEGGGPGVTFVVTNLPDSGVTCTVTESGGPDGYTPVLNGGAGCEWTDVTGFVYNCDIVNEANPATFIVNKVWEVNEESGEEVVRVAEITITCDAEIEGGYQRDDDDESSQELPAGIILPPGYGDWMLDETVIGNGSVEATIDTSMGPVMCGAEETSEQSGVEVTDDCGPRQIAAGATSECTITNTVFFEGIPSLNQYGLAIMALLMLGLGMVGFRRFV